MKEKIKDNAYGVGIMLIIISAVFAGGECDTVWQQIILAVCCLAGMFGGYRLCQWSKKEDED